MTPEDKKFFIGMFIRVLSAQALTIAGLAALIPDKDVADEMFKNSDRLIKEIEEGMAVFNKETLQ